MHDPALMVGSSLAHTDSPLLVLSILLVAGIVGGWLAHLVHIPAITGNILAGIVIGPAILGVFGDMDVAANLQPLSTFAMCLITVGVGSQLSYQRIHNALRRIFLIAGCEVIGAVVAVTLVSKALGLGWPQSFLLGCIAAATAPATTVALIRENRAKGTFVKTLLTVVALDNMLCIMLFAFSSTILADFYRDGGETLQFGNALLHTAWQFVGSFLLGHALGFVTDRLVHRANIHDFSVVFVAILLAVGLSEYFALRPLLTGLFMGAYLGNISDEAARQTRTLSPLEPLLFVCFFTVAGASLHFDNVVEAGLLCVAYILARGFGKGIGATLGGLAARASKRIWSNAGLGLVPQAGVAIGLVVLLQGDENIPREVSELIATTILGAVTLNEIVGPFFTKYALQRANEANKDGRRLMEFLQEEFILTNMKPADKWDALRTLTQFYARTHRLKGAAREELFASIEERELEVSTALGLGAAIPHGRVQSGQRIQGVLGICPGGVDFGAPDGAPVRLIMLVVTPDGFETEHLEVMKTLVRMISDERIRTRLIAAISANDAWEVIEGEETPNYNYYLDDPSSEVDETGLAVSAAD